MPPFSFFNYFFPFALGLLSGFGFFALFDAIDDLPKVDWKEVGSRLSAKQEPPIEVPPKPTRGKVVFYGPDGEFVRSAKVSSNEIGRLTELLERRDGM